MARLLLLSRGEWENGERRGQAFAFITRRMGRGVFSSRLRYMALVNHNKPGYTDYKMTKRWVRWLARDAVVNIVYKAIFRYVTGLVFTRMIFSSSQFP